MIRDKPINVLDMVWAMSGSIDLLSDRFVNHHRQVGYASFMIGAEMGLKEDSRHDLLLAGLMHDMGAICLKEELDTLAFDMTPPFRHAALGYFAFSMFAPFANIARIIKTHHVSWRDDGPHPDVSVESSVIHLADALSASLKKDIRVLEQSSAITDTITSESGSSFMPEAVKAFKRLAQTESFWLNLEDTTLFYHKIRKAGFSFLALDNRRLVDFSYVFRMLLDFRARHTAAHSSCVGEIAGEFASLLFLSAEERTMLKVAGYLHDVGMLAVPNEVHDKNQRLTSEEFNHVKAHPYHTYSILKRIEGFETINRWASLHHERMDGQGYPFHLNGEEIPLGARVLAVADVYSALSEDRPHRPAHPPAKRLKMLKEMTDDGALDQRLVKLVLKEPRRFEEIYKSTHEETIKEYEEFQLLLN